MKFQVRSRQAGNKAELGRIRREGNIPAVLYSKGEKGQEVVVDGIEFKKFIDKLEPGTLSSKVLELELDGKSKRVLIKDIQYHITTYRVLHLDFEQLHDDHPVAFNLPIRYVGAADCVGVKLGGVLRPVLRSLPVRALPAHMLERVELDVRQLALGQSMRLSALKIPATVKPQIDLKEVAVVVSRR